MSFQFPNDISQKAIARKHRVEVKYFFPLEKLDVLLRYIQPFMKPDEHALNASSRAQYSVGSTYFDTRRMDYYWSHVEGYPFRKKIRIRRYDGLDGQKYYMEIKEKNMIESTKYRWLLADDFMDRLRACQDNEQLYAQLKSLAPGDIKEGLCHKIGYDVLSLSLRPVLYVDFTRMAFRSIIGEDVRLTVDYGIRASSCDYPFRVEHSRKIVAVTDHEKAILELKFNKLIPAWMQNILLAFDLRRTAYSKYRAAADKLFQLE